MKCSLFILKIESFEMGHLFVIIPKRNSDPLIVRLEGVFNNFTKKDLVVFLEIMCSLMHNSCIN